MTNQSGARLPRSTALRRQGRANSSRGFPRRRIRLTVSPAPDSDEELLDELRESLKRMKVLEGLSARRNGRPELTGIPSVGRIAKHPPPKRFLRGPSSPWKRVAAIVMVGLLLTVAAGWLLYEYGWKPGVPPGGSESRWKDESVTHFTFAAAGDFGGPGSIDSIALVQRARTAGMSFLLALGDLGYTANEAAWCGQMKRYVPELLIIAGSHDDGEMQGGNLSKYITSCPYPWSSPPVPGVGTPGYGFEYYFDYPAAKPLARFVLISAGLEGTINYSYSEKSAHTEWVEDAVKDAREKGIPWVIAGAHRQCISVGKKDRCSMGQDIFDELVEAKVDLILTGHDHVYERSNLLARSNRCESVDATDDVNLSCVIADGRVGRYPAGSGSVVVVQGVGGNEIDNITIDGSRPQLGYIAEAMGGNTNTKAGVPGFGSVFYTVSAQSINAKTDFCPPGAVAWDGQCTANLSDVFKDGFSIRPPDVSFGPLANPDSGAAGAPTGEAPHPVEKVFAFPSDIEARSSELGSTTTSHSRSARWVSS